MQRVAIARALVHNPAILVADEPTGNLDTVSGDLVLRLIRRAADEFGAAVVMATHSAEAAAIADVRVRMRDGSIENTESAE
jgi:ABC-type lipoprotein export system ATPase subunit